MIRDAAGRTVWDLEAYGFLTGDCPDEANPSLWRQSRLSADHGLFEVVEGIYQIRGFDLSNMTVVEGERGVLVIDPLISAEPAAAALALYREHRGDRPVTGVLYTHSHVDHFGGVRGVVTDADIGGGVPVIAPRGFLEHAVSENVYSRHGDGPPRRLHVRCRAADGRAGPDRSGTRTDDLHGLRRTDPAHAGHHPHRADGDGGRHPDGLPDDTRNRGPRRTEHPLPRPLGALHGGERHPQPAQPPDAARRRGARPEEWARYLTEAVGLFGDSTDVAFASHHWPVWGRERAVEFLTEQRDVYAYLHDQTLRMLNRGDTPLEIAEAMEMPPALERAWHTHGYYGSVSHNTKAVYQRYMGWFDGNPAHLWEHPPVQSATRYVEFMGGADEVLRRARESFAAGDFRWVVQVVNHVVFADPDNAEARDLQADALEQLGYGSENGTWRNFYLTGALELRHGPVGTPTTTAAPDFMRALTLDQLFDALAIRVDGPRSWDADICVRWSVKDREPVTMRLRNGVLTHVTGIGPAAA